LPISLQVRKDVESHVRPMLTLPHVGIPVGTPEQPRDGLGTVFLQLQEDVATYVCINALRQCVRNFAHDALLRLIYRDDVEALWSTHTARARSSRLMSSASSRYLKQVGSAGSLRRGARCANTSTCSPGSGRSVVSVI
jgi:hypothetical protein